MTTHHFTFSLRDAAEALELLHDTRSLRGQFAHHASNHVETESDELADEFQQELEGRRLEFERTAETSNNTETL